MKRMHLAALLSIAAFAVLALGASSAQAYVPINGTNCILRATAPIDVHDGNDPSEPWHSHGEIDCNTVHQLALDVYMTQLLSGSGWTVIRSTVNSAFKKWTSMEEYTFAIPYLTLNRWYCGEASGTIDNKFNAHYSSQSVKVDSAGVEHFGTC